MFQQLNEFKKFFNLELATSKTKVQLTTLKDQYLGRKKGKITLLMKDFKTVPASAKKKELGKALNQLGSGQTKSHLRALLFHLNSQTTPPKQHHNISAAQYHFQKIKPHVH